MFLHWTLFIGFGLLALFFVFLFLGGVYIFIVDPDTDEKAKYLWQGILSLVIGFSFAIPASHFADKIFH